MTSSFPTNVSDFWFGPKCRDATGKPKWFAKSRNFDDLIKEHFFDSFCDFVESVLPEDSNNETEDSIDDLDLNQAQFGENALGRLGLIILLDQLTRNMFRDTSHMYQADPLCLALSKDGINRGWDKKLPLIQRVFFYMPFMHSEVLTDQEACVGLFAKLAKEAEQAQPPRDFSSNLQFAIAHRDIIKRFGRFPHRNQLLERISSAEEKDFLKKPGSSF